MIKVGKILGSGYLANTSSVIYTCPLDRRTVITNIEMVNISGSAKTLNLQVLPYLTVVKVNRSPLDMNLNAGFLAVWNNEDQIVLSRGDVLYGDCSVADSITYLISGYQENDEGV